MLHEWQSKHWWWNIEKNYNGNATQAAVENINEELVENNARISTQWFIENCERVKIDLNFKFLNFKFKGVDRFFYY